MRSTFLRDASKIEFSAKVFSDINGKTFRQYSFNWDYRRDKKQFYGGSEENMLLVFSSFIFWKSWSKARYRCSTHPLVSSLLGCYICNYLAITTESNMILPSKRFLFKCICIYIYMYTVRLFLDLPNLSTLTSVLYSNKRHFAELSV